MSKILGLGTTIKLLDLSSDGLIAPKPEPVTPVALVRPKRTTMLKPSDYRHVMNQPRPPKPESEWTESDMQRMIAAAEKRERRMRRSICGN